MDCCVHCYSCLVPHNANNKFFLANCGHTFCSNCVPNVNAHKTCRYCNKRCETVPMQLNQNFEMSLYFKPIANIFAKLEQFKISNNKHLIDSLYRQAGHSNQEVRKRKEENEMLKRQLEDEKKRSELKERELNQDIVRLNQDIVRLNQELAEIKSKYDTLASNVRMGAFNNIQPNAVPTPRRDITTDPRVQTRVSGSGNSRDGHGHSQTQTKIQSQRSDGMFFNFKTNNQRNNTSQPIFNFSSIMATNNSNSNTNHNNMLVPSRPSSSSSKQHQMAYNNTTPITHNLMASHNERTPSIPDTPNSANSMKTNMPASLFNRIIKPSSMPSPLHPSLQQRNAFHRIGNPARIGRIAPYSPLGK